MPASFPPDVPAGGDVTRLLHRLAAGDAGAAESVLAAVYNELRRVARDRLHHERDDHTLATTDLVHEAYLRLVDVTQVTWRDRAHFFATASIVMRRVLVDWARARRAEKRGGGGALLSLDAPEAAAAGAPDRAEELLALDDALDALAQRSARQARVVECRYFAGLSHEETAEALGVSLTTVKQDWRLARAWLLAALRHDVQLG